MAARSTSPTALDAGRRTLETAMVSTLRSVVKADQRRKDVLKTFADQMVTLRGSFIHEGHKDWGGESPEYRAAIAQVYRKAGVPPDSGGGLQAAIRYQFGNILRKKVLPAELALCNLDPDGPLDRAKANQAKVLRGAHRSDPIHVANYVIDWIRDLAELKPRGEMAMDLVPLIDKAEALLKNLRKEMGASPRRRSAPV